LAFESSPDFFDQLDDVVASLQEEGRNNAVHAAAVDLKKKNEIVNFASYELHLTLKMFSYNALKTMY
jgi:hypothetical protein